MKQPWRHRLRRLRFWVGGLLATLLIGAAVLVGLVQLLLPLAAHYPQQVAAALSARLQRPVSFASMQGHWRPSGPLLDLKQVSIGGDNGKPALSLPSAQVKLDLGALLWPSRHLVNLRLSGLSLRLLRDSSGVWHLAGFGRQPQAQQGQTFALDELPGNLWLEDLKLSIEDAAHNRHYALLASTVRLSSGGGRLRFAGLLRRPGVEGALHVIGRFRDDGSAGRIYARAGGSDLGKLFNGLDLAGYAVHDGQGSAAVWVDWAHGRVHQAQARIDLSKLHVDSPRGQVQLSRWRATFSARRDNNGLDVYYDQDQGQAHLRVTGSGMAQHIRAAVRTLDVGPPLALLGLLPSLPEGTARWLIGAKVHGQLARVNLDYSRQHGLQHVDGAFSQLGMAPVGKVPGVDHLQGTVLGDAEAIDLTLPEQSTVVRMPHTFREPLALSKLGGDVLAWHTHDGWRLGLDDLVFEGQDYGGSARGQVRLPATGGRPFMALYVRIDHGKVPAAKLFWPVDSMAPKTVEWLDKALVDGTIESASALVRGSLADWPFHHHQGRFDSTAHITHTTLNFSDEWPNATDLDAQASFVNNGMLINASEGHSLGNTASSATASIEDFAHSPLTLTVKGSGPGKAVGDYLRQSPIASRYADTLKNLSLGGSADFSFSLVLPLHHDDAQPMTLDGDATLKAMDVSNPDWRLRLSGVTGNASFDAHGFKASGLSTRFRGVPSTLDLALGQATGDPNRPVKVGLSGRFAMATLLDGIDSLKPLVAHSSGRALMHIGVDVDTGEGEPARTELTLDSDLTGVALDLPAPLDKPAAQPLPLHMSLGLPVDGAPLDVRIGTLARVRARLADSGKGQPMALAIGLGAQPDMTLPSCGLRVGGHAGVLDVSGWAQSAMAWSSGEGDHCSTQVDVQADAPTFFGKRFDALRLQLAPRGDGLRLNVAGKQAKGTLDLPGSDLQKKGITARLDRLYWPADSTPDTVEAQAGSNRSEGQAGHKPVTTPAAASSTRRSSPSAQTVKAASASGPPITAKVAGGQNPSLDMHVAPASLPPLHLWVGDLRLGKAHLGSARFESWPTARGMHIDQLRTHARDVQITASGDWTGTAQDNQTHLVIDFGAESLGHLLTTLGFEGIFDGGRTQAHLDASWPGPPSSVALATMNGHLGVDVSKGRIPEVQPGVGRLFGLMSIAELPRRLTLDFGDVFRKGFGFDAITGHFRFADGNAYTDDLHIKGPAADISISGRTGLRAHDYDQQVLVVPHVGNSLPVVGALAGGPVGAAAGFAVQKLIGGGLNRAASARYHVGGSWDKPKITLLEKKPLPRSSRSGAAAPAAATSVSVAVPPTASSGAARAASSASSGQ
ncbi:YhdP family protein [Oleiagrimonas sp. C23AA]|uniref:YhdP family protein n=1 Tax=Oleiagrimonas sp. C23AA TaxID=2719047 RepID=UPI001423A2B7|nr:YhdP family protein [Oleiagrimonas sp. C23AA]NII10096.1 TIGR02099 family protein [Oleiagrimonas sp. C23AA]